MSLSFNPFAPQFESTRPNARLIGPEAATTVYGLDDIDETISVLFAPTDAKCFFVDRVRLEADTRLPQDQETGGRGVLARAGQHVVLADACADTRHRFADDRIQWFGLTTSESASRQVAPFARAQGRTSFSTHVNATIA